MSERQLKSSIRIVSMITTSTYEDGGDPTFVVSVEGYGTSSATDMKEQQILACAPTPFETYADAVQAGSDFLEQGPSVMRQLLNEAAAKVVVEVFP